jgi:phosphonate transport system ATP-binding protein
MSLFALERAQLGYGSQPVLSDVSLVIEPNERVAVIGPSGAGKSTLLSALYQQQKDSVALVPQDGALVKQLSVYHNVYIGRLHRHGTLYNLLNLARPWPAKVASVSAILRDVSLDDKLFAPVGELSGGERQRTAVARALYRGGDVLLGDEPVSAVDGAQARRLLEVVDRSFATVVLVMHDVELALRFTTRVIGVRAGRILFDRPAADVTGAELDELYQSPWRAPRSSKPA